jgi:hypothetical protein
MSMGWHVVANGMGWRVAAIDGIACCGNEMGWRTAPVERWRGTLPYTRDYANANHALQNMYFAFV